MFSFFFWGGGGGGGGGGRRREGSIVNLILPTGTRVTGKEKLKECIFCILN